MAFGWVHNLNAWVMNSYYLVSSDQNFLGCTAPGAQTIALPGFQPGVDYHISWFPTRMNDTILPAPSLDTTGTGTVLLDFSSAPFGGVVNQYLDTLHADYAFIVALHPVPKNMSVPAEVEEPDTPAMGLDFRMFPNPAGQSVTLVFASGDKELDIALYDLSGKCVLRQSRTTTSVMELPTGNLARGAYAVRVSDGRSTAMKTLILR
ncbi:MAG TPA: T9SS type A sorting domain-containing protein [Flavobacteriales bacterium]|nr:T9SS type A sorting domain-containing protein [Flavobacteriales bacterium]